MIVSTSKVQILGEPLRKIFQDFDLVIFHGFLFSLMLVSTSKVQILGEPLRKIFQDLS